jgi:hypothetical protein
VLPILVHRLRFSAHSHFCTEAQWCAVPRPPSSPRSSRGTRPASCGRNRATSGYRLGREGKSGLDIEARRDAIARFAAVEGK